MGVNELSIPIFKRDLVQELYQAIERNVDYYINGDFEGLFDQPAVKRNIRLIDGVEVDDAAFGLLLSERGGLNDAHNANLVYNALKGMTPYLAADERVWVALTHTLGLRFSSDRWIKKSDKAQAVKDIRLHFFCRIGGNRSYHRTNALASLWWWGHAASRVTERPMTEVLRDFVGSPSFRADVIERPTTSRVDKVFRAIMACYTKKMEADPNTQFFSKTAGKYRDWLKLINLSGGTVLYAAMPEDQLIEFFSSLADQLE